MLEDAGIIRVSPLQISLSACRECLSEYYYWDQTGHPGEALAYDLLQRYHL
mgnify:CR=1